MSPTPRAGKSSTKGLMLKGRQAAQQLLEQRHDDKPKGEPSSGAGAPSLGSHYLTYWKHEGIMVGRGVHGNVLLRMFKPGEDNNANNVSHETLETIAGKKRTVGDGTLCHVWGVIHKVHEVENRKNSYVLEVFDENVESAYVFIAPPESPVKMGPMLQPGDMILLKDPSVDKSPVDDTRIKKPLLLGATQLNYGLVRKTHLGFKVHYDTLSYKNVPLYESDRIRVGQLHDLRRSRVPLIPSAETSPDGFGKSQAAIIGVVELPWSPAEVAEHQEGEACWFGRTI